MRSFTSATRPPRSWIARPPSPSTRASASTTIDLGRDVALRTVVLIGVARHSERCGVGVERAEGPHQLGPAAAEAPLPPAAERGGVRRLGRAEAAEAAP